ncbi:MAG: hypothetical protein ACREPX_15540, partial [Rhodanobacteraceae bacterium]
DPSGFEPCPPGYECSSGPGNELENTIHKPIAGANEAEPTIRMTSGTSAMLQDMIALAKQRQELEAARQASLKVAPTRSADGTPIAAHGGKSHSGTPPNNPPESEADRMRRYAMYGVDALLQRVRERGPIRRAVNAVVLIACVGECNSANAPTNAETTRNAKPNVGTLRRAYGALRAGKKIVDITRGPLTNLGKVIDNPASLLPDPLGITGDTNDMLDKLEREISKLDRMLKFMRASPRMRELVDKARDLGVLGMRLDARDQQELNEMRSSISMVEVERAALSQEEEDLIGEDDPKP